MTTMETCNAFGTGFAIIRQSAPMAIGKHDWRVLLVRRDHDSHPFVEAEYRRNDGGEHTGMTPCGPIHVDGRMWRRSGDCKGRTPKRLAVLLDATPWARMRPHLRAIVERAEGRECLHDNRTKQTLETLFVDERCGVDSACNGHWRLAPGSWGEPEWRLRGPFTVSRELQQAAVRSLSFLRPIRPRPDPAEPADSSPSSLTL